MHLSASLISNKLSAGAGLLAFAAAASLSGCGVANSTSAASTSTSIVNGGASMAYALSVSGQNQLIEFPLGAGGTVTPNATVTLPASFSASAVAVDPNNGTVYVGGQDNISGNEVLVFPAGSNTASRSITVQNLDFDQPMSMTVDNSGQLYVLSVLNITPTITVFAPNASGAASPVKSIGGVSTGIYLPTAITTDATGNIFVSDIDPILTPYAGSIIEFSSTATGNAPPVRAITSISSIFNGVAVDASGNIWAVQETDNNGTFSNAAIVMFAPGLKGQATPTRTITGSNTQLGTLGELQMDAKGNVYVANQTASGQDNLVGFGPGANGNIAPEVVITPQALTSGSAQFAIR